MATAPFQVRFRTVEDLLKQIGGVDPARVRLIPAPGSATEEDLIRINQLRLGFFELIEGVLVEKPMGLLESLLAATIIRILGAFVASRNLGFVSAPDGFIAADAHHTEGTRYRFRFLGSRLIRSSEQGIAGRSHPRSRHRDFEPGKHQGRDGPEATSIFRCGVRLVWEIDPDSRAVDGFRFS